MSEDLEFFTPEKKSNLTIKDYISKYLAYWPFIIASIVIFFGAATVYLRYAIPKYQATTNIIIKGSKDAKGDLLENALKAQLKPDFNMMTEYQMIRSESLLERVVTKKELNISYYLEGKLRKTDIHLDAPFRLIPQNIADSSRPVTVVLKALTGKGGLLALSTEDKAKSFSFNWNQPFKAQKNTFILTPKTITFSNSAKYIAVWKPIDIAASEFKGRISAGPFEKNASIIQLTITTENLKQGTEVLNAIAKEYDLMDIEDRNIISQNTIRFIDDRLNIVSNELSGVEGSLVNYQGRNKIVNLDAQFSQNFGNANNVSQTITDVNVKKGVVDMIGNYFNNPATADKLVPSALGIDDPTLSGLIGKYNDLQLTKQRESPLVAPNSTVMQDLNNQLTSVKGNILETLQNISKNLKLQENNLQQQNGQYNQFLSSLPRKERMMQEIKRKQSITEGLYLYLLQKREEAAVSSTSSNVSNYKQIEPAISLGQVAPNSSNVKMYSILLGLLLPIGVITLKDFLNDKVMSRTDITKSLSVPILGDISHFQNSDNKTFAVLDRDILGEQFRIIRTNLSFLLKSKEKPVILVSSSTDGEGKSFVSLNIAAVLAMPGKKVALLQLDLRKPPVITGIKTNNSKGLSNYLAEKNTDLKELYTTITDVPTLHIYTAGNNDSNAGDLLLSDKLSCLIENLKLQYDFIVIDSAPTELVSDAFVLGEYSDVVLYTIRQRSTSKKQLNYLNDIITDQKLSNIGIIFNDVKTGGKLGYYGYGSIKGYAEASNQKKRKLTMG